MSGVVERHQERIRAATDFEGTFAAVARLRRDEGDEAALRAALRWCAADGSSVRAAGLDVLSALVQERDDVVEVAVSRAAAVDAGEQDEDLRWSAAHLLASLPELPVSLRDRALHEVLRFERDPDGDVRWQVVFALPSLVGRGPGPEHPGVQALLRRLDDADAEVRDWAAFGLGVVRVDTPAVRQGLRRLVERPDEDAAGEAAVALARLSDAGVLPVLLRELAEPTVGNLWVEAAAELAAPEALPLLERLQAAHWAEDEHEPRPQVLEEALLACRTAEARRHAHHGEDA